MNYQKLIRKLRQHPLLWDDGAKGEQVGRLIDEAKRRIAAEEAAQGAKRQRDTYADIPGWLARPDFA
jgi:hypothetical protein